jgi:hypothetical protein
MGPRLFCMLINVHLDTEFLPSKLTGVETLTLNLKDKKYEIYISHTGSITL